jgi:hypothetical protein
MPPPWPSLISPVEERNVWWGRDARGRMYRFEVEEVAATDVAVSTAAA